MLNNDEGTFAPGEEHVLASTLVSAALRGRLVTLGKLEPVHPFQVHVTKEDS